jgi:hypothetical protein
VFSLPITATPRRARSVLACVTALAASTTIAPVTSADAALINTAACNGATLSQPFRGWGDDSAYELLPGGDFESASSGWALSAHAQRVPGSEPFAATGSAGAYSLSLTAGDTAQSPFTCVNAAYPTFRFFARTEGLLATVLVQVVYKTALGPLALPLGTVALSGEWRPTLPMLTGSVVVGVLSGGTAQAALRFTALTGSSRIDDVFVDPRMR